jgi:hypothetical protein
MLGPTVEKVESFELSLEEAERFLLAGGTFTIWDWITFPEPWREVLVIAQDRVQTIFSVKRAAAQSPDGMAEMVSPLDGGHMKVDLALQRAADSWGRK